MPATSTERLEEETGFGLPIPEPFDFRLTVAKPAGWHWSTLDEIFSRGVFWSGIYLNNRPVGLRMSASGDGVNVTAYTGSALTAGELDSLKTVIRSGLGADDDLAGFYRFAKDDPVLSSTVDHLYGMRVGLLDDVFGRVILAILLQMAPLARSQEMMQTVLRRYGRRIAFGGREITLWPEPATIAALDDDDLKKEAKVGYRSRRLVQAARFLSEHPISLLALSGLSASQALKRLVQIPGIGSYSAGIILGRASLPIDAWSAVIMSELVLGHTPQKPRGEIEVVISELTERWHNWSWFAFVYIVNDLERLARTHKLSRLH